jgi:UDP-N-acetylglucosamine 1-carboxyvinyltransferase
VTGTVNVICAAVLAEGTTVISHAAREPEVIDLCHLLQSMGAKIDGIGESTLTIEGKERLRGTSHTLIPDRIEFGTFLLLALITRGEIMLPRIQRFFYEILWQILREHGAIFEEKEDGLLVLGNRSDLKPFHLQTAPFPGFPTDLQALFCALLTQVEGKSTIQERIYPNRFMHIGELQRMGASIYLQKSTAVIEGKRLLSGAALTVSDLRAGACLYLAALAAQGESLIGNVHHLDRGYENFEKKLSQLGAIVKRETGEKGNEETSA